MGKRKIVVDGKEYYWFVRVEKDGSHRIHIMTEDKKVNRLFPVIDTEASVTPADVRKIIETEKL